MVRFSRRALTKLPQQAETWNVITRMLHTWIGESAESLWRPYITLIYNQERDLIQESDMGEEPPTSSAVLNTLQKAMRRPPSETGQKPHRPRLLRFEDQEIAAALADRMADIGVEVQATALPEMDGLIQELETHLQGGPELPGLLTGRGVTPEIGGSFFAAAAEFYQAEPWINVYDEQTFAISLPSEKKERFFQIMGGGGVTYGLAMYRSWKDVERMFKPVDDPLETLPPGGGHSLSFEAKSGLPFADIEALDEYDWPVAAAQAYPVPVIFNRSKAVKRPGKKDLLWYEAALRTLPAFIRDHLQVGEGGDFAPAEGTISATLQGSEVAVRLKYPGGTLPKESRPTHLGEWPDAEAEPGFDRRTMEGIMAQFGGGFDDPALGRAQQLMYEAWEASNAGRRIALAREALSISADCADAYVLLAEEGADTLQRACEYYQQGVAAGERALGQDYFEENAGHFWGLLETRPYMRARQGLANCLWELGRPREALPHYRDMLRLNPSDNQGIRYVLLNLLLTLNEDDAVEALLREYRDDGMAEWLYTRALITFRRQGAGRRAERALEAALDHNPHVPAYLTGRKRVPNNLPPYLGFGDENEAKHYAADYLRHWRQTPGAVAWLKQILAGD